MTKKKSLKLVFDTLFFLFTLNSLVFENPKRKLVKTQMVLHFPENVPGFIYATRLFILKGYRKY